MKESRINEILAYVWDGASVESFFPNSEILFDFNEGSNGVFKDHLMF